MHLRNRKRVAYVYGGIMHAGNVGRIRSGGARPQNLGGHLRGKLIFWGGGKIEFLKRYCYLPMPLSQDFGPPPRRFAPLSKGGDIPRNTAPGGRLS
jgi:hypothetical protein